MLKKMIMQGLLMAVVIAMLAGGYAVLRAPGMQGGLMAMAGMVSLDDEGDDE